MKPSVHIEKRLGMPVSLLWLIGFNLVGRILWILYMHPVPSSDFRGYFTHAVAMAAGHGYMAAGRPTAYWPMGWPVILSIVIHITGPYVMAGLFTNALFSTLIVAIVYGLTMRVLGGEADFAHRVSLTAAMAYSLLPSQIEWNAVLGSEESFTLLLLLALFTYVELIHRDDTEPWFWRTGAAGLIFGVASVIRPIGLLFPFFLGLYELGPNKRHLQSALSRALTFTISMLVGILPVTVRNMVSMHHLILVSTNGGVNLWQGIHTNGGYFWSTNPAKNPLLAAGHNEVLRDHIGKEVAFSYIFSHPLTALQNGLIKIFDLYRVDTNAAWYTFHMQFPDALGLLHSINLINNMGYWAFMTVALIGLATLFSRTVDIEAWLPGGATSPQKVSGELLVTRGAVPQLDDAHMGRRLGLLLTFVLYNTLLFLFFPAWDRFRYPVMPLFAILFAIGWYKLLALMRSPH